MIGEQYNYTLSYRRSVATSASANHSSPYNTAIMRALSKFPEARQAVIAELDRIGQVPA